MQIHWLVLFLVAVTIPASAQFYPFDPAGSVGTGPSGINASGVITGTYAYESFSSHGFVRDPQGNITSFDPTGSVFTIPTSINASGAIAGNYDTATGLYLGFVRDAQGNITSFDVLGSGDTQPFGINARGAITGYYLEDPEGYHGFVRDAQGNITPFDPVGSISTVPGSINDGGAIAGTYQNANSTMMHGFIRDARGNITSFDPTGSTDTLPANINASGVIAGSYFDAVSAVHGFIRDAQGNITSFDPPGSTFTTVAKMNDSGTIAGSYVDAAFNGSAFVRDPQGNYTFFELPWSSAPGPSSINDRGAIVGLYQNYDTTYHGFVGRVPNTTDISNGTGAVSAAVWQNAQRAGVSNVIVQAWRGGSQNSLAEAQLLGAQSAGLNTGAYILLNYFKKDSVEYQIGQAIDAIGSAISDLRFIVVDVETCCGEFTSWKASTAYALNSVIMDPANHIQKAITAGTSGPAAPAWNDAGGTPADGSLVWQDTGKVVIGQRARIDRISAAVSAIQADNLPHGAVIYTAPNKSWQTITGSCGTGWKNNCASLIALPLWDVEYKTFYDGDGLLHCGDGIAGLVPFTPFSFTTWQARSGNQYDWGFASTSNAIIAPSWDEYELGLAPAEKRACNGETNLFGLPASSTFDLDYFDPTLFQ
jgi:hypothetical protein